MKRAYDLSDDTDQEDRCPDCGGCDCIVGECLAQVDACGYCDDPECVHGSVCGGYDEDD